MRYALALEHMKASGVLLDYICQPKVWLGVPEYTYTPDFLIIPAQPDNKEGGTPYYVDVKGMETTSFKRHKKMWKEHGSLSLIIVKETSAGKFKTTETIP